MPFFPCAHASHPVWQHALKQVVVQLQAQLNMQQLQQKAVLGMVYVSEALAPHGAEIVRALAHALPQAVHWVGSTAPSVLGGDIDYAQTGAIAVMLPLLSEADYQVFSGLSQEHASASRFPASMVLVHGEAAEGNISKEVRRVSERFGGATLAGGLCKLSGRQSQVVWGGRPFGRMPASIGGSSMQVGGLSGIAFSDNVRVMQVGMQSVKAIGEPQTVTAVDGDWLLELNGQAALPMLLECLGLDEDMAQVNTSPGRVWRHIRQTLVSMQPAAVAGADARRAAPRIGRVVGLDPMRQAVCIDAPLQVGQAMSLCAYDEVTARLDMRRACAELWEELTSDVAYAGPPEQDQSLPAGSCISGAIYIRNQHRMCSVGAAHQDAELQLIRHALGPVPLIGFTSTSEVDGAALQHLSAQLIVFVQPLHGWS